MTDSLDDFDYWRLCEELTVLEAALLIAGQSPAANWGVENWNSDRQPKGYEAAKSAIKNALRAGKIDGEIIPEEATDENGFPYSIKGSVALSSRVNVESLKTWLIGRGFRRGFFFPEKVDTPDYLDPNNPRYAPKLAAAVAAWMAVTDTPGSHPKQVLVKWLRENAVRFGLTDDEGKVNETGIEEAAKVANWQPSGGAPKTPTGQEPP